MDITINIFLLTRFLCLGSLYTRRLYVEALGYTTRSLQLRESNALVSLSFDDFFCDEVVEDFLEVFSLEELQVLATPTRQLREALLP